MAKRIPDMPYDLSQVINKPVTAVLGPTNTGKTHFALDRMAAHESGMIGLPLRLLAREVFDKMVARKSPREVALVTGEEKIIPPNAKYFVCTVEAMPLEREVAFMAIDEIQLAADAERGRIFTQRLLLARGTQETLLLGSDTMRDMIKRLIPDAGFVSRERFSRIEHAGHKKVTRLPRRSAIVAFSAENVYSIAELIRRQRGGAAVIMGALSPRTRNAQAALYQSGEVDYLVATDAIGMGLNMDIDHVAFAGQRKYDGRHMRRLTPAEMAQIAGRAGRHVKDGTFGATADCPPLDEDVVEAIENHEFDPVTVLQWRSNALDFGSLPALIRSLEKKSPRMELAKARLDDDEEALRRLSSMSDIADIAKGGAALKLLWEVCQTPDFRKIALDQHAKMLADIYRQLIDRGRLDEGWLAPQIERLDRNDGDVDALSTRIAHIRTWTYLTHRSGWLDNDAYWQEKARAIEDNLSDALHEKLTQRFIDRRTSVLLKKLKDDLPLLAGVNDQGEVVVEGQFVGRLIGFQFILDPRAKGPHAKAVRHAALTALKPELAARAAALANAKDKELELRDGGIIWWRQSAIAQLEKGPLPLRPNIKLVGIDQLPVQSLPRIEERLQKWFADKVEGLLLPLTSLQKAINMTKAAEPAEGEQAEEPLGATARGLGFRLIENFGATSRAQVVEEVKALDQTERGKLRKLGVRFGEYTIFMPGLLKPAPAQLLTFLWALWSDEDPAQYEQPKAGLTSVPADKDIPHAYYYACGFRPSGLRAVRIDMLERLAQEIRAAREGVDMRDGFEATSKMMSLVGCSGEEFESILKSLGLRKNTVKRMQPKVQADTAPESTSETPSDVVPAEAVASEIAAEEAPSPQPDTTTDAEAAEHAPPAEQNTSDAAKSAATPEEAANASLPASEAEMEEVEVTLWKSAPRHAAPRKSFKGKSAKGKDGKPFKGRKPQGAKGKPKGPRTYSSGPSKNKKADPDSPFAVLASLKGNE
jgi:ATP-dependent RNA helicase SUPV3L1/SUV3